MATYMKWTTADQAQAELMRDKTTGVKEFARPLPRSPC